MKNEPRYTLSVLLGAVAAGLGLGADDMPAPVIEDDDDPSMSWPEPDRDPARLLHLTGTTIAYESDSLSRRPPPQNQTEPDSLDEAETDAAVIPQINVGTNKEAVEAWLVSIGMAKDEIVEKHRDHPVKAALFGIDAMEILNETSISILDSDSGESRVLRINDEFSVPGGGREDAYTFLGITNGIVRILHVVHSHEPTPDGVAYYVSDPVEIHVVPHGQMRLGE